MNQKVLIAYASRCGSTMEVAQAIADELTKRGFAVDIEQAAHVRSLEGYQAVLVGSAVRYGRWLPEAVTFVQNQQAALNKLPTAFFTVHMMNLGDDETSTKARVAYTEPVRAMVKPGSEAFFTGKTDLSKLSLFERIITKMVKGVEGDFRDWDKIRDWGQAVLA